MKNNNRNRKIITPKIERLKTAPNDGNVKVMQRRDGYVSRIVPKAISRTRSDITTWKNAQRAADNVDNPRRAKLCCLYDDILQDAHLTSQIELRLQHVLSIPPNLKRDGVIDDEQTARLRSARFVTDLNRHILMTPLFEHTLVELNTTPAGELAVTLIPRTNVVPEKGLLLLKEDDTRGIEYRNCREYGIWILEFGSASGYGLLNKAVPHVLFKRFAQSCWSELCEIYAIPPRYIKTDTQDPEMLDRAEAMLRDMGSAAYFVIDTTEEFQFAKGADTNGEVYRNLISLCRDEISMLINGVVVGQDTKNGNRSKEESSIKLLDKIIQADRRMLEEYWNGIVMPALVRTGFLPEGLTFELQQEEDIEKLWGMTKEALPYMEVDPEWITGKFGIRVTGKRETPTGGTTLKIDTSNFFD